MTVDRLQWLTWLCNFTGIVPSRMIRSDRGTFQRFELSWKHPITWWFVMILCGQLIWLTFFLIIVLKGHSESHQPELSVVVATVLVQLSDTIGLLSPQLILFHLKRLGGAVECIHREVDEIFLENWEISDRFLRCTTRSRTAIGTFVTFIWVGVIAAVNFSSYTTDWAPIIGRIPAIFSCITSSMLDLQMGTWFLMIHISYYSITHRISTLVSLITMDNGSNEEQSGQNQKTVVIKTILVQPANDDKLKKDLAQKLRICGNVFSSISRATADLNYVFSVPVLLILVTKLINSTFYLFQFLLYYLKSERPVFLEVQDDVINFSSNFIFLMTLMTSFDLPIYELRKLREQVMMNVSIIQESIGVIDEDTEISTLLLQLREDRLCLTAGGMFTVGRHLIPSLTAAVLTYLLVLLQSSIIGVKSNLVKASANNFTTTST